MWCISAVRSEDLKGISFHSFYTENLEAEGLRNLSAIFARKLVVD